MIVSCMDESSALMIRFTSSYLQVIALFIRRIQLENGKRDEPDRAFNQYFVSFDTFQTNKNTGESDGTSSTLHRLFDYFKDHVQSTIYANVANSIFENLFVVAVSDDCMMIELFDLSWVHLNSVYVHIETSDDSQLLSCPFAVAFSVSELTKQSHTIDQQCYVRIIIGIINKLVRCIKSYDSYFLHLHVGMIRHWGILTASSEIGFPFLLRNLATLGNNLNALLESFDASVKQKAESLHSDDFGKKYNRKIKKSEVSLVVGLDISSFPEFFETLLNLVIATVAALGFGQQTNNPSTNLYQHIIECFGLFRILTDTYKDHIHLFPSKSALTICCASKDLLQIAVRQVNCTEWRVDKSLRSRKQQTVWLDDNVTNLLEELTDRTSSFAAMPILSLCDIWQKSKAIKKSKISSLRLAVTKAVRQIKDISPSHNMSSLGSRVEFNEIELGCHSEGFRTSRQNSANGEQSVFVPPDTCNATDYGIPEITPIDLGEVCLDENNNDDNMFGVTGYWGDGVNDDEDNDSICSLIIENPDSSVLLSGLNITLY